MSADMNPVPGFEQSPGGRASAEQVALSSRYLGAQSMQIPQGSSIRILDLAGTVRPETKDQQVVRKGAWDAMHSPHHMGPRVQQERHHSHAQRASLWYAARAEVGLPQVPSNRVVEEA